MAKSRRLPLGFTQVAFRFSIQAAYLHTEPICLIYFKDLSTFSVTRKIITAVPLDSHNITLKIHYSTRLPPPPLSICFSLSVSSLFFVSSIFIKTQSSGNNRSRTRSICSGIFLFGGFEMISGLIFVPA